MLPAPVTMSEGGLTHVASISPLAAGTQPVELAPVTTTPHTGVSRIDGIWTEKAGSGVVSFTKAGIVGTRIFDVPWFRDDGTTWLDDVQYLVGKTVLDPNTNRPVRTPPDVFSDDLSFLFCQEVQLTGDTMRGYDTSTRSRIGYRSAILNCKYMPLQINESLSLSAQSLTLPGTAFAWTNSATDPAAAPSSVEADRLTEPVGLLQPQAEYVLERQQILAPDLLALLGFVGTCNSTEFIGFAARTLLMTGAEGRRTYLPNGSVAWDITFRFSYNPREHVKLFRPKTSRYEYLKTRPTDGSTNYNFIYTLSDFMLLTYYA